jgi:hypothetical protein
MHHTNTVGRFVIAAVPWRASSFHALVEGRRFFPKLADPWFAVDPGDMTRREKQIAQNGRGADHAPHVILLSAPIHQEMRTK